MRGNKRSVLVKKNIIGSFILKGLAVIISLLVVPLTIDYVNPTQYGIWLTLSSLLAWFSFFDIGLTHGFRNRFAEARAKEDDTTAKIYVSTTYAALAILIAAMLAISLTANNFVDWSDVLNIDPEYRDELGRVFMIIIIFFGINMVAATFTTMLIADQKPALASLVKVTGQAAALAVIYILTRIDNDGGITNLAFVFSGIPVGIVIISSVIFFSTKYREVRPSFRYVRFGKVKDILGLGVNFFIITTSMLFIFQLMNIIISRELGPESVTEYNIAYRYFSVIQMFSNIIAIPFWSAFTDAYTRKEFNWMKNAFRILERYLLATVFIIAAMYLCSQFFYHIWIKDAVEISTPVNLSVAVYMFCLTFGNIYMYMINGTGKVRIEMLIYLSFGLVAYPVMTVMCKHFAIPGLLAIPAAVYITQGVLCRIQLRKIMSETATGLWNK